MHLLATARKLARQMALPIAASLSSALVVAQQPMQQRPAAPAYRPASPAYNRPAGGPYGAPMQGGYRPQTPAGNYGGGYYGGGGYARPAQPYTYGQQAPGGYSGQRSGFQQPGSGQANPAYTQSVPNRQANYNATQQRQAPAQRFWQQQPNNNPNAMRGEHLQQWMEHHNQMNPQEQQRALTREPGFNQLPQQTQQRMLDRLQRLNSMPTDQRERVLQRSEQMERLTPDQRRDVRNAMGQLGALPADRRRAVARSFRELRPLSPAQRSQLLNSPEYHQQFSDEERGTIGNLLTVSPMLPQQ